MTESALVETEAHRTSGPVWLTAAQVAEQLQCGIKTVYRAVKRGKLRGAQIDGRGDYRFKQEWVDQFLETCATPKEVTR
jgi:excisionase family DNA binding protein